MSGRSLKFNIAGYEFRATIDNGRVRYSVDGVLLERDDFSLIVEAARGEALERLANHGEDLGRLLVCSEELERLANYLDPENPGSVGMFIKDFLQSRLKDA